ncbi:MAG TPA: hypothetical protein VFE14_14985 [Micromonosporaceae bacterium]|jgi:hypothetical protein|nr:hypothetical protein [Micromonosporaceae bacterium]
MSAARPNRLVSLFWYVWTGLIHLGGMSGYVAPWPWTAGHLRSGTDCPADRYPPGRPLTADELVAWHKLTAAYRD